MRCIAVLLLLPLIIAVLASSAVAAGSASVVPMIRSGDTLDVQVSVNGVLTVPMTVDTGANEVVLTQDLIDVLQRANTIDESYVINTVQRVMANGRVGRFDRVLLRYIEVGGVRVNNVIAVVASGNARPLLGMSYFKRVESFSVDARRQRLTLGPAIPFAGPAGYTVTAGAKPTQARAKQIIGSLQRNQSATWRDLVQIYDMLQSNDVDLLLLASETAIYTTGYPPSPAFMAYPEPWWSPTNHDPQTLVDLIHTRKMVGFLGLSNGALKWASNSPDGSGGAALDLGQDALRNAAACAAAIKDYEPTSVASQHLGRTAGAWNIFLEIMRSGGADHSALRAQAQRKSKAPEPDGRNLPAFGVYLAESLDQAGSP